MFTTVALDFPPSSYPGRLHLFWLTGDEVVTCDDILFVFRIILFAFEGRFSSPFCYYKKLVAWLGFIPPRNSLIAFELCGVPHVLLHFKVTLRVSLGGGRVPAHHFVSRQVLMC